VGPYLIWSVGLHSCLSLEGTGPYPDLLGRNRWHVVPSVQGPDSSPRAYRRVGAQGRSPSGWQIEYSYITVGTDTGFGGDVMRLEPPWS
jgi:hypothetical protein